MGIELKEPTTYGNKGLTLPIGTILTFRGSCKIVKQVVDSKTQYLIMAKLYISATSDKLPFSIDKYSITVTDVTDPFNSLYTDLRTTYQNSIDV